MPLIPLYSRQIATAIALFAASTSLPAQKSDNPETVSLSAISLIEQQLPPLFYKNAEGEYTPFNIEKSSKGSPNIVPALNTLPLYRESVDAEGATVMRETSRLDLPSGFDRLLLAIHYDRAGAIKRSFIDERVSTYGPGQIRFQNLGKSPVALLVGQERIKLDPGAAHTAMPGSNKFTVQFASVQQDGSITKALPRLIYLPHPSMRALVLFTVSPIIQEVDGATTMIPQIKDVRLYDRVEGVVAPPSTAFSASQSQPPTSIQASKPTRQVSVIHLGDSGRGNGFSLNGEFYGWGSKPVTTVESDFSSGSLRLQIGGTRSENLEVNRNWKHVLAVADAGADKPLLFENSLQSHPAGTIRIINLSPYQMAYAVERDVKYLSPMRDAVLTIQSGETNFNLSLALKTAGGWQKLDQSARQMPGTDARTLLLAHPAVSNDGERFQLKEIEL